MSKRTFYFITDGSLDQTFGNGGKVSTSRVQHYHRVRAVAQARTERSLW